MSIDSTITAQAVGAYGERVVEAELLRRGWLPGNLNQSVTNAARFDIIAVKGGGQQIVPIRVKTCSPKYRSFQFLLRNPESENPLMVRAEGDFFILVSMGRSRSEDVMYIVPTIDVQRAIVDWRDKYLGDLKKDGGIRKDTSQWTLHLGGDEERLNSGFEKKWKRFHENWDQIEHCISSS